MKVIVVDDEPAMHLIMRKMLAKIPGIQLAGVFADTQAAAVCLREQPDIELAFIDLNMPGQNGLAFTAQLESLGSRVQVVFVTSHKEFALEAYELSVMDYLVKPVTQERLQRTVNRLLANKAVQDPLHSADASNSGQAIVTMLGDVTVSNGMKRVKWISRKSAELFAYLLLHRGKRIPRARLIADIFGGMLPSNAEKYLNTTVYQLRKSLELLGMRESVSSENDGYALDLASAIIDYEAFEQRSAALHAISPDNQAEALHIERLFTGDLFGDKAYVWAIHETEHYAELYRSYVLKLAAGLMELGDISNASKLLHKLNERNPLDEAVISQMMEIHGMTGDRKGLAALYNSYARLLSRELGIRPSDELQQTYNGLTARLSAR